MIIQRRKRSFEMSTDKMNEEKNKVSDINFNKKFIPLKHPNSYIKNPDPAYVKRIKIISRK